MSIEIAKSVATYTNPAILKQPEPTYSQEQRIAKITGSVSLVLHVSEKGKVDNVWLLRPLGFGLDENAADTVRQYVLSQRSWMASQLKQYLLSLYILRFSDQAYF